MLGQRFSTRVAAFGPGSPVAGRGRPLFGLGPGQLAQAGRQVEEGGAAVTGRPAAGGRSCRCDEDTAVLCILVFTVESQ